MAVAQIGALVTLAAGTGVVAADLNTNYSDIKTAFNNLVTGADTIGVGVITETFGGTGVAIDGVRLKDKAVQLNAATVSASLGFSTRVQGEGVDRYQMNYAGKMLWSPGNAASDTSLERTGVGELTAGEAFKVGGDLTVSGDVGIGTSNPDHSIEIRSATPVIRLRDTGDTATATAAFIEFGGTTAAAWSRTGYVGDPSSGTTDIALVAEQSDLHLGDSSSPTVLNLQGGNVGIGETAPDSKLEVNGTFHVIGASAFDSTVSMGALTASGIVHAQSGRLEVGTAASGGLNNLQLWDAGTYFRIQSFEGLPLVINSLGNNVLIGTTTDAGFKLDVNGTARTGALTATTGTFSSYLQGTTGNGYLDLRGDSGAGSGVRIDDSGNVLIGTTTPATGSPRLDVVGDDIVMASNVTDASTKAARFAGRHYTNAEQPMAVISGLSTVSANTVHIGGNETIHNTATAIEFYTAANPTTIAGTLAADITGVGASSLFHVRGALTAGALTVSGLTTLQRDSATVTDPTVVLQNLDETAATLHTILQRYQFNTTASATVTAAELIYSKEQDWTSTGTTQDTKAALWLAQDGNLVEVLRLLGSDKSAKFFGQVRFDTEIAIGRAPVVNQQLLIQDTGVSGAFILNIVNPGTTQNLLLVHSTVGHDSKSGKVVIQNGLGVGTNSGAFSVMDQLVHLKETETITGAVTDGYAAALNSSPGYNAASALQVDRHNYWRVNDPVLGGAGPASVVDAPVMTFDAAIATHAALAAAFNTTDSNSDATSWAGGIKVNVNGTMYKIPIIAL